ncbi:MAG: methylmalonyl-CoA epimerase [Egibacteraceae bacterium]
MHLQRIDHVGYAVEDLAEAIDYHRRLYGAEVAHRERMERDGVDEALLAVGDSFIQLLAPTRDDSPVGRFLERNGPGVHHVGYGVADVAATLADLKEQGVRVVDDHPRPGSRGCTVAFLHPKGAMGVLVELVEDPVRSRDEQDARRGPTLGP